jgi:hypothetical protein
MRYTFIATGVICARITPNSVEATVYSLFAGMGNLGFGVLGGLFGNFWAIMLQIDELHMDNFYLGLIVKLGFSLVPFMFLGLIYNKEEIETDEYLKSINNM